MIMKVMFVWCSLVIILMKQANATPLPDKENINPEEVGPIELLDGEMPVVLQGDILLNKNEAQQAKEDDMTTGEIVDSQRGIRPNYVTLWPGNTLYYDLSRVSGWFDHPNFIRRSLNALQTKLGKKRDGTDCMKFIESTSAKNRVKVTKGPGGCYSYMGMQPQPQILNLPFSTFGSSCKKVGTVQHEFLHALGFFHTQMRSDRDKYITIYKDNINKKFLRNFDKYTEDLVDQFGLPFDYDSVMMYPKDAFAGGLFKKTTIKTKDSSKQNKIGQRDGVDAQDVEMVRKAYRCD